MDVRIPVHIVGIWRAKDPGHPYWFYDCRAFNKMFLVWRADYFQTVVPQLPEALHSCVWHLLFDPTEVRVRELNRINSGILRLEVTVQRHIRSARLLFSPQEFLADYHRKAEAMKVMMYVCRIPIFLLAVYYVFTCSQLVVERQSRKIAVLKSRGLSTLEVMGIYIAEGLMAGIVALALGPFLGMAVAFVVGKAHAFLSFTAQAPLTVTLSPRTYCYAQGGPGYI